jgi:hypothetical protein
MRLIANTHKRLIIADRAKWLRIGKAVEEYIGNDKKVPIHIIADRWNLTFICLYNWIQAYYGDGCPVTVQIKPDGHEQIDTVRFWIDEVMTKKTIFTPSEVEAG